MEIPIAYYQLWKVKKNIKHASLLNIASEMPSGRAVANFEEVIKQLATFWRKLIRK